jgi:hypothetical protein
MSDLLNDVEGRAILIRAKCWTLHERLSRFFKRNAVIDLEQFRQGGEFDLSTLLGQLNPAHDDELRDIYHVLGHLGCLSESIDGVSVYVDADNGSDVTGTGSLSRPYASLWFLDFLPDRINHYYRILIKSDLDEDFISITNTFGTNGCLSFLGVGPAQPVYAFLNSVIAGSAVHQNTWREIRAPVAPATAALKAFIQMTDGNAANMATPVNRVDVPGKYYWFRDEPIAAAQNGDAFRFIVPAYTLKVKQLSVQPKGDQTWKIRGLGRGAHVCVGNLTIELDDQSGTAEEKILSISGDVDVTFGFCQIATRSGLEYPVHISGKLNRTRPLDAAVDAIAQSGVANIFKMNPTSDDCSGIQCIDLDDVEFDENDEVISFFDNAEVHAVDCMAHTNAVNDVKLYNVSVKKIYIHGANMYISKCCFDPNAADTGLVMVDSKIHTVDVLFGTCTFGAIMTLSDWRFEGGGGDAAATMTAITSYAIELSGMSRLFFTSPWTGTTGSAGPPGDLVSNDPLVAWTSAFPAANSIVTDAMENNASRAT